MNRADRVLHELELLFPKVRCELQYHTPFELLVSVILSAQATDKQVNKVTPRLFSQYPTPRAMAAASQESIEACIRSIGLYKAKAGYIQQTAHKIVTEYNNSVPKKREELIQLPGVGGKTANVVLAIGFSIPALAVDTHVMRTAKRLGLVPVHASVSAIERLLCRQFPEKTWIALHMRLVLFGRYVCKASRPSCAVCPFREICLVYPDILYKKAKKEQQ